MLPRKLLTAFLLIFLGSYIVLSIVYRSELLHKAVKTIVEREMSAAFRREIKIESLTGNLLNQVKLHNVVIASKDRIEDGTLAKISRVTADYSLWKALRKGGDILAAIETVQVHEGRLNIIRDKNDHWNLLDFLLPPPLEKGAPRPPPLSFSGKIYFQAIYGSFTDEKGWGTEPLSEPFVDHFDGMGGIIDFSILKSVGINLTGRLKATQEPFSLTGILNGQNAQFKLNVNVPKLDAKKWGPYIFPVGGFQLSDDEVAVDGTLKSKDPFPKNDIPFYYSLNMGFKKLRFKMPFFPVPLEKLKGKLHLHNTDKNSILTFRYFEGEIYDIPVQGKGDLVINRGKIFINIQTQPFKIERLKGLFPALSLWDYSGEGSANLRVAGDLSDPIVTGNLKVATGKFYGLRPKDLNSAFKFYRRTLDFNIVEGTLFAGEFGGGGAIDFSSETPSFSVVLSAQDMLTQKILPRFAQHMSPSLNARYHLAGDWKKFKVRGDIFGSPLSIFRQPINRITMGLTVLDHQDISIDDINVGLSRGGTLKGTGTIKRLKDLHLRFQGKGLQIQDIDPKASSTAVGSLDVAGSLRTVISRELFENPGQHIVVSTNMTLKNGLVYGQEVETGHVSFDFDRGKTKLHEASAINKDASLRIHGQFDGYLPVQVNVKSTSWPLSKSRALYSYVPASWKPFSGQISTALTLSKRTIRPSTKMGPWERFKVDGSVQIDEGTYQAQPFDKLTVTLGWNGTQLTLHQAHLKYQESQVGLTGTITNKTKMNIRIQEQTRISLSDFSEFTSPYGSIGGTVEFKGQINGTFKKPEFDGMLHASKLSFNQLAINELSGAVKFQNNTVFFTPLTVIQEKNLFSIRGFFDFSPFLNNDPFSMEALRYRLDLSLEEVDIHLLARWADEIYGEILRLRKPPIPNGAVPTVPNGNIIVKPPDLFSRLAISDQYYQNGNRQLYTSYSEGSSVGLFQKVATRFRSELTKFTRFSVWFKGRLSGNLLTYSRKDKSPVVRTRLTLRSGELGFLASEQLKLNIDTEKDAITLRADITNGQIGNSPFEELGFGVTFDKDSDLIISKTTMKRSGHTSMGFLQGRIPLGALWDEKKTERPMNLLVSLKKNDIDVVSLFTPFIDKIQNDGEVTFQIDGPLRAPVLNGQKIVLKNARIYFNKTTTFFRSPFVIKYQKLPIVKNRISVQNLQIDWRGEDTRRKLTNKKRANTLIWNGDIALRHLNFQKPSYFDIGMDLRLTNSFLSVRLKDLFFGDLSFENIHISGDYRVPLTFKEDRKIRKNAGTADEAGPTISGQISVMDGRISFPSLGTKPVKPAFLLDLSIHIKSGVYIEGGFFGGGLFSFANNFFLELEETKLPLLIKGTFNLPRIERSLFIVEGTVNFFDRVFELLPETKQSQFFKDDPEKISKNEISFVTDLPRNQTELKLIPVMNIKAVTFQDPLLLDTPTDNIVQSPSLEDYRAIVILFRGRIDELENALYLEEYRTRSPLSADLNPQFIQGFDLALSSGAGRERETQGALRLIMPAFLETGEAQLDEFGKQQANVFFRGTIRPYEKRLAKKIGLHDLRLDYDVGSALFDRDETDSGRGELAGVNLVAGLVKDRLYLRLKTDVAVSAEGRRTQGDLKLTEVELTYFFASNFTLNFSNISDYWEVTEFSPRFSLKFSQEF